MKLEFLARILRKCTRVVLTLLCVLIIFFTYVHQDPWLARTIEQQVDLLMNHWCDCCFHADFADINLVRGYITLKNCAATHPTDATQWSWHVDRVQLRWSWADLLTGKKCAVACVIEGVDCYSKVSKDAHGMQLAIMPHLILLTAPPAIDIPFILNGCTLSDGRVHVYNGADCQHLRALISAQVTVADAVRVAAQCEQCTFTQGTTVLMDNGSAKATLFMPLTHDAQENMHHTFEAGCTLPALPQAVRTFKCHGSGAQNNATCTISNADQTLQGTCTLTDGAHVSGTFTLPFLAGADKKCTVALDYNHAQQTCDIDIPHLTVSEFLQGVTALYQAHATITPEQVALVCSSTNHHHAELMCNLTPAFEVTHFAYSDGQTELMTCQGTHQGFTGTIPYVTVRRLTQLAGFELQGTGECHYAGALLPTGLQVQFDMPQANIRVPMTYSVLQKVAGTLEVDMAARTLKLRDSVIDIHKGKVFCSQATAHVDAQGCVKYLHLPLVMHKCFLGWRKDFFALMSGCFMMTYTPERVRLEGACLLDQAYVRGNPLSAEFQKDFFESALSSLNAGATSPAGITQELECDVSYTTKTPIEIKTPFLEGAVICEGQCTGTIGNPHVTGKLEFVRGTLEFPYKPLYVTKGEVVMRPEALDDPYINLVARNHIKKYDVELAVTGTVRNPQISFTSSPHLEQPNIITLLLGGSEDGSLYFLMPKVMTDTLETLLFGSVETTSRVQKYLQALFKPFKSVSLVPRLSDQAGRGGVRGSLAVEVNERLRALIEKNVSLPEDTTFEIEYDISDDTSFRFTRDERGDYGLLGEMRWKF